MCVCVFRGSHRASLKFLEWEERDVHSPNTGREVRHCLLLSSEAREKDALCDPALEMSSWTGREFRACSSPEAEAGSLAN